MMKDVEGDVLEMHIAQLVQIVLVASIVVKTVEHVVYVQMEL